MGHPHDHDDHDNHHDHGPWRGGPPRWGRGPRPGGPGGPGGPFGWGGPPWGGPRMRRGDIRPALLDALGDGPGHGYELMRRLSERSGGRWRPSPGSVYPTLQMLEEEGLVRSQEADGKKVYELTDEGRAEVEARRERAGDGPPWARGGTGPIGELRDAVGQLMAAARQVGMAGSPQHVEEATRIVTEARRKLYELLANA